MALMNVLDLSSHAVDHVLGDTDIGETALIESSSEEHTYAIAYLLSWKLLLVFFKSASSEVRCTRFIKFIQLLVYFKNKNKSQCSTTFMTFSVIITSKHRRFEPLLYLFLFLF